MEDPKKAAIRREYGRKPYMPALGDPDDPQSELSQMERMRRVPNKAIFDQRDEAHSEFLKPYLSDDYQAMEHWYPPPFPNFAYPGAPNFQLPEFGGAVPGWGDDAWFRENLLPCSIICSGNGGNRDCDAVARCRFFRVYTDRSVAWSIIAGKDGKTPTTGRLETGAGYYDLIIHPPSTGWNENVPSGKQSFKMTIQLEQKKEGEKTLHCTDTVTIYCNPCPPDVAISWNGSPPATIDAGGNVNISVTGGEGPYTYVVTGTGYTWNANGSATLVSNIQTVQLDCTAGT